MRKRIPPAAVVTAAGFLLAACGSAASPAPAAPALPAAEQAAITAMTAHCTQGAAQLASMVSETHQLEVKDGITGESATALAGHLATVVAGYGAAKKVSCVQAFAAYLTEREG